jgi:hypothetical protein
MTENKIKPYSSWIWDEEVKDWVTPNNKPVPGDGKHYTWNDETLDWVEVTLN